MSGNNDNNKNYSDLTKKEQENVSAQKAGQTGARAAADAATGGQYEKIRNVPLIGKLAKKREQQVGKKIGDLDKATGGKVGRVAKPLNDSGAIDTANKGMDVAGGKLPDKNLNRSLNSHPSNNQTPGLNQKPNFAKNGINNDNNVPNGNSEGANKSRLRNIFDRKKSLKDRIGLGGSSDTTKTSNKENNNTSFEDDKVDIAAELTKRFLKKSLMPIIVFLVFILVIMLIITSENSDKGDASAGDNLNNEVEAISGDSVEQNEFYENIKKVKEEYEEKGKKINAMYITATYHILNRKTSSIQYEDMTEDLIKEMAEGMLGGNSTYSKEAYTTYLKEKLLPKYNEISSSEYDEVIEDIFEYIDEYMEDVYGNEEKKSNCYNTTGGSCTYKFNGIHGLKTGEINLSNIQVRLMSSSDCPGGRDNVVLDESLLPFEEYVLGVGYGELGPYYNEEVAKVHLIAARSFALARPYSMNGAMGVKIIQQNNNSIIQLRNCASDQVFCNTKTGCSTDYNLKTCNCQPMVYSGSTSHKYTYQQPLSNHSNSTLKTSWQKTMGMVGVDKDGKIVLMPYQSNMGNKDPKVWLKWAKQGKSYKEIILAAYPEIAEIKQASCNNTTENTNSGFLRVAKEIWTEITNTFGNYTNGNMVPPLTKTIDCSTYVDWVLYKYGYEDFKGNQKRTDFFYNTNLTEKYGWTEIPVAAGEDVTSKLKPGDILVRHVTNAYAHMNIIVEVRSDGSVWGYDCGNSNNWKSSKGGKLVRISTSFVKSDSRPGKIIRVTNSGTGDNCETAESGEWSEWRQNGTAPWRNISLGSGKETIASVGCYVTSIAIQIARSGAKTSIPNFNPGTFVNEIKKTPNAFNVNGALSWQGEASISNFVPGFSVVSSHVALGRTKEEQIETVQKYIDQGYYVLLNVKGGGHWVAVTGTTKDNIQMVDPGRNEKNVYDVYSPSSVVQVNVYSIK